MLARIKRNKVLIIAMLVCNLVITILTLGGGNIQKLFLPSSVRFTDEDIYPYLKDFITDEEGRLKAQSENPWISLSLDYTAELKEVIIYVDSLKTADENGRIYYGEGEILGDKYVDFYLHEGENKIFFADRVEADTLRLDLTYIKGNILKVDSVIVELDNVVRRQFIGLIFLLLFVEGILVVLRKYITRLFRRLSADRNFAILMVCTSVIFLAIYGKFIWSDELFAYTDVGSDTFYGYLGSYISMMDRVYNVDFSLVNLFDGFGNSIISQSNIHMELPFIIILCLFGKVHIYQGLMFCTFLKIIIIELFAFLYFQEIKLDNKIATIGALIWGFSAYNILWGQHAFFLTGMLVFSILMFVIEKIIQAGKKGWWIVWGVIVGLYSVNNIYFLYSFCATIGIYYVFRLICLKTNAKEIIKLCLRYIAETFLGIGVFLFISTEWVLCVLESARSINLQLSGLINFDLIIFCNMLGRLISAGSFGIAEYSGMGNLYEAPVLSTSILIVVSCYWVCKKKHRNIIPILLLFVAGFSPAASRLLIILNSNRWMYVISFFSVVAICITLDDILCKNGLFTYKDMAFASTIALIIIIIIYFSATIISIQYEYKSMLFKLLLLMCYIFLLKFSLSENKYYIILFLICFELIGGNFSLVNNRININQTEFETFIAGETQDLIEEIKAKENSKLYRIRDYNSRSYLNHSQVLGYMGTDSYSSLNKKYIIDFIKNLNEMGSAYSISHDANHADISCENYAMQTLLGVKYIVTDDVPPIGYTLVDQTENLAVYYNEVSLPFGLLYNEKIDKKIYMDLSPMQKNLVLYDYYYDDENSSIISEMDEIENNYTYKISKNFSYDEGLISGVSSNKEEWIEIERKANGQACEMVFDMTVPHTGLYLKVFYAGEEEDYCEEKTEYVYLVEGTRTYSVYMESDKVEKIKIIPIFGVSDEKFDFSIQKIHFVDWETKYDDVYIMKAKEMSDKEVFNVGFTNDEYHAYCIGEDEGSILMVPLAYSVNWSAYVNGERVKVKKINDGFCGIELPKGECRVVMRYKTVGESIWIIFSFICMIVYIIRGLYYRKNKIIYRRGKKYV